MNEHYHVVEFINGCLNDYDSGPIETLREAREELRDYRRYMNSGDQWARVTYKRAGTDRYERGIHILKIESCREDCDANADAY